MGFSWQERRFDRRYVLERGSWRIDSERAREERSATYTYREGDARPCGRPGALSPDWQREPGDAAGPVRPVCTDAAAPRDSGYEGERRTVRHVEVTRVFGCSERVERTIALDAAQARDRVDERGGTGRSKVPQRLSSDAVLGGEAFQIRAAALDSGPPSIPDRVLRIATWGKEPPAPPLARSAALLGGLAVAQAEFYYATQTRDPAERAGYLWNMRWRARLRRFRLPSGGDGGTRGFEQACRAGLGARATGGASLCQSLLSAGDLIAH